MQFPPHPQLPTLEGGGCAPFERRELHSNPNSIGLPPGAVGLGESFNLKLALNEHQRREDEARKKADLFGVPQIQVGTIRKPVRNKPSRRGRWSAEYCTDIVIGLIDGPGATGVLDVKFLPSPGVPGAHAIGGFLQQQPHHSTPHHSTDFCNSSLPRGGRSDFSPAARKSNFSFLEGGTRMQADGAHSEEGAQGTTTGAQHEGAPN